MGVAARVCDVLERDAVGLLTLVGAPGIGKTCLCIRTAADLQSPYAGGVVFAEQGQGHLSDHASRAQTDCPL